MKQGLYGEARAIHAFLLKCEGLTVREVANRLGVTYQYGYTLINVASRKITWGCRKARWKKVDGTQMV